MNAQWLKLLVLGCLASPLFALSVESAPYLITIIGNQDGAIDYNSIRLKGDRPTFNMHFRTATPIVLYGKPYETAFSRFSLNCGTLQAQATADYKFIDKNGSILEADLTRLSPILKIASLTIIPADGLQPLCLLKKHGFSMPSLSLTEEWEEMRSPTTAPRVFEAPSARQYKDGFLLVKQKNEFPSGTKFEGRIAPTNLVISLFDCQTIESRLITAVRLDDAGQPISGIFGKKDNVTPRLPENRQRLIDACQTMRAMKVKK